MNLEMVGYIAVQAFDSKEALDVAKSHHFDLCLLDIMLPGLDGFQLIDSDFTVLYARDISNIYEQRIQNIYLSLLIAATLILLLGLLSYLYSSWITRPIERLNQTAQDISKGNYSIRCIPTKNEFGTLGNAYVSAFRWKNNKLCSSKR